MLRDHKSQVLVLLKEDSTFPYTSSVCVKGVLIACCFVFGYDELCQFTTRGSSRGSQGWDIVRMSEKVFNIHPTIL